MFRSLASKLTLAFLLVGLTGSILVTVIIQRRTRAAFDKFIITQEQQRLAESLVNYYQARGSWDGVADALMRLQAFSPQQPIVRNLFKSSSPFTLVGIEREIIFSSGAGTIGEKVSRDALNDSITLMYNDETIGWLIITPARRIFTANTPEGIFLRNVNIATLLGAGTAILLAVLLGGWLSYRMTSSLRELTEATIEIAKGKLGKQVAVRSKDEIGELATSFNKMSVELDQATQVRRQMTADIAHDLRSPLSVITGYAEALADNKLAGTGETYNILLQEAKHLEHLVDDLRLLTLADTGELSLIKQPTAARALLERVAARHSIMASQRGLNVEIEASDDVPLIDVDVERMAQVMDNLMINAFRYTPEGGKVRLSAKHTPEWVEITVSDTGSGIQTDDLPHVFDRFYRGDKSRRHNGESGLGLAIARSIVEAHGGRIKVESEPGKGAIFTVALQPYQPNIIV